ncbi:hypothetical protein KGA66_22485 [Actinocrinis puniceicyclus]|uniref:Uncharacterized protein n=1 Tax=Actinocrinis puniceicyclus TaxID=977794 RepID=A0A8J7WNT3_9ACTN|nr:hypothetical protein [Actinocrinis puniceicyclus]MBS2965836.1 hypothetical protein [Actinocrinis puniceicyclus]
MDWPDGWVEVPLRDPRAAGEAVGGMLAAGVAPAGGVAAAEVIGVLEQFATHAARAAAGGGIALYVPPIRSGRPTLPAAIQIAEVAFPLGAVRDPDVLVARVLARDSGAQFGMLDGAAGVRVDTADAARDAGAHTVARRIEYMLAVPHGGQSRWLSFALTFARDMDRATAESVVGAFDAAMATLRWADPALSRPGPDALDGR